MAMSPRATRRTLGVVTAFALLCCSAFVGAREMTSGASRIIGGNPVDPGKYQEYVSITTVQENGTYIKPYQFELVRGWTKWRTFKGDLQYNDANTESGRKEMQGKYSSLVKKIVFNPKYHPIKNTNDVALIFLKNDLPRPYAKLPKTGYAKDLKVGEPFTVVGFGRTNNYFTQGDESTIDLVNAQKEVLGQDPVSEAMEGDKPPVLYGVTLKYGGNEGDCKYIPKGILCLLGEKYEINDAALDLNEGLNAALSEFVDSEGGVYPLAGHCTGDSGGPAFDKHGVQVGVNSFVENFGDDPQTSCRVNFWTVNNDYTDVRDNLRWIRSAIKS